MALQAQQIVSLACGIAKAPGYSVLAGQLLNAVLSELCENYDLEPARTQGTITLQPAGGGALGSGPYALPTTYLRMAKGGIFYYVNGEPYNLISIDLSEFDNLVQQPGISYYPEQFATDNATQPVSLYVWPPPGSSFVTTIRYYQQMPDITTPETSAAIPWFPNQNYLITRLAGEVMKLTNDDRCQTFLGDGPAGAQGILERWLKLQNDDDGRAKTVSLDRRKFGRNFDRLPNTKTLGF